MVDISNLTVLNAKQVDSTNWIALKKKPAGAQKVPNPSPDGDCTVRVDTSPHNNEAEWKQITWSGGDPVKDKPNLRRVNRDQAGMTTITASIGSSARKLVLWIMWADCTVLTAGDRPAKAIPWKEGEAFPGPDKCGAVVTQAWSMGTDARGQIVVVAKLSPAGVGKMIVAAAKQKQFVIRRQVTAHDFVDGARFKGPKSWTDWAEDTLVKMQSLAAVDTDEIYDTDAPDLPTATQTAETYNHFRQWLEWDGQPCSDVALWFFQARWKDQKVTLNEVGPGNDIPLPKDPFFKKKP